MEYTYKYPWIIPQDLDFYLFRQQQKIFVVCGLSQVFYY
uniref:NADH-plastoquinone oxidoreductase subunit 5 n=1 Tax=Limodorum abortivum TaxID=242627 RepID=A0A411GVI0_9ASPA|nr:NADH-plastoquinone oxidoreductase subunit 5 [Limodorum abortivum]